jgi:hypothetical protein
VTIEPWDSRAGGYHQTINLADGFADALKSEASNNLLMQLDIRSWHYQDSSAYPSCARCRKQTGSDMLLMSLSPHVALGIEGVIGPTSASPCSPTNRYADEAVAQALQQQQQVTRSPKKE